MNDRGIIERIKTRLEEVGESSFDVSLRLGRNRNFLNDLIVGRKKTFAASVLPELAMALNCDVEYLLGLQDRPRKTDDDLDTLPVMGSVEPGVWRRAGKDPSAGVRVPMRPDARYAASQQRVWLVRGDILDGQMITHGTAILTADVIDPAALFNQIGSGDLLVIERERDDLAERTLLTARRGAGGIVLYAPGGDVPQIVWQHPSRFPLEGARLAGLVLQVIRFRA